MNFICDYDPACVWVCVTPSVFDTVRVPIHTAVNVIYMSALSEFAALLKGSCLKITYFSSEILLIKSYTWVSKQRLVWSCASMWSLLNFVKSWQVQKGVFLYGMEHESVVLRFSSVEENLRRSILCWNENIEAWEVSAVPPVFENKHRPSVPLTIELMWRQEKGKMIRWRLSYIMPTAWYKKQGGALRERNVIWVSLGLRVSRLTLTVPPNVRLTFNFNFWFDVFR
jgi:hypothetical protein